MIAPYQVAAPKGNVLGVLQNFMQSREGRQYTAEDRALAAATRNYLSEQYGLPMGIDPFSSQQYDANAFSLKEGKQLADERDQFTQGMGQGYSQTYANSTNPYERLLAGLPATRMSAAAQSQAGFAGYDSKLATDRERLTQQYRSEGTRRDYLAELAARNQYTIDEEQRKLGLIQTMIKNQDLAGLAAHGVNPQALMMIQDDWTSQNEAQRRADEINRLRSGMGAGQGQGQAPQPSQPRYTYTPEQNAQLVKKDYGTTDLSKLVTRFAETGDAKVLEAARAVGSQEDIDKQLFDARIKVAEIMRQRMIEEKQKQFQKEVDPEGYRKRMMNEAYMNMNRTGP